MVKTKIQISLLLAIAIMSGFSGCSAVLQFRETYDNSYYILEKLTAEADKMTYSDFDFAEREDETCVRSEFFLPEPENSDISISWKSSETNVHITGSRVDPFWTLDKGEFLLSAELMLEDEVLTKEFTFKADFLPTVDFSLFEPGADQTDVPIDQTIVLPFNAELNRATVNSATVVVHDGISIVSGRISYSGNCIIFNPYSSLKKNTEYTVWLSRYIKVIERDILSEDISYTFTTGRDGDEVYYDLPRTIPADFSGESGPVSFDLTYHEDQTVPSDVVKYDTDTLTGTNFDDVIRFSGLESGENFYVNGGSGYNILDLANYPSYDISVYAGQSGEDDGTVTVTLSDGGTATVYYTDFQRLNFSTYNFTGSPHFLEFDTSGGTEWIYSDKVFETTHSNSLPKIALIHFAGSLQTNFNLDLILYPYDDGIFETGLIVFDYVDSLNFKYVRAKVMADNWVIGAYIDGVKKTYDTLQEPIEALVDNPLELRVTGADGKTAELWSSGLKKGEYEFSDSLNDGFFGIATIKAHSRFTIDMTPSNWAPYGESFEGKVIRSIKSSITLNLLENSYDYEREPVSLSGLSTPANGSVIENGDGTITYTPNVLFTGADIFSYSITDGTNVTTSEIRIDVLP